MHQQPIAQEVTPLQLVVPVKSWKVPAAHDVQPLEPAAEKEPVAQLEAPAEPAGQ